MLMFVCFLFQVPVAQFEGKKSSKIIFLYLNFDETLILTFVSFLLQVPLCLNFGLRLWNSFFCRFSFFSTSALGFLWSGLWNFFVLSTSIFFCRASSSALDFGFLFLQGVILNFELQNLTWIFLFVGSLRTSALDLDFCFCRASSRLRLRTLDLFFFFIGFVSTSALDFLFFVGSLGLRLWVI